MFENNILTERCRKVIKLDELTEAPRAYLMDVDQPFKGIIIIFVFWHGAKRKTSAKRKEERSLKIIMMQYAFTLTRRASVVKKESTLLITRSRLLF